jgi:hypothetical protein
MIDPIPRVQREKVIAPGPWTIQPYTNTLLDARPKARGILFPPRMEGVSTNFADIQLNVNLRGERTTKSQRNPLPVILVTSL